jgi:tetratricopeptide (TPR) repeat protein
LDWDFNMGYQWRTNFYPEQSILVHDGAIFTNMFVYGPSLTAVDQYTGRMLWAKGPMAATTEDEWLDRFQSAPAAGRGTVIAPVVHDDIRGRSHIASTAELAAFETRTGKVIWRKWLARISPLKITQSRYPRKIRILSSTPLVREGVVYHCTNAGVVAAVDEQTGDIRWLTAYPQDMKVLDNFSNTELTWANVAPVVRGNKLYVTPSDCGLLLCLDTETGRILWTTTRGSDSNWDKGHRGGAKRFPTVWRLVGFSADGLLVLTGDDVVLLDPENGQLAVVAGLSSGWMQPGPVQFARFVLKKDSKPPDGLEPGIDGEGEDYWFPYGRIEQQATLTKNGLLYCFTHNDNGCAGGHMMAEFTLDLKKRKFIKQRRWFTPRGFILDGGWTPPIAKRPVNEEPEEFRPAMRMGFTRWGVPFEINVTNQHIVCRYDRKKMETVLVQSKDLDTLFAKAEIARKQGDVKQAIELYESCKPLLPSEEEDRRRNLNLRLYPLYMELARWGHQAADFKLLEEACQKLGATASNPGQEIRALLAYAELHEKRKDFAAAMQVLQNASRHYWREPLQVSVLETGDEAALLKKAEESLKNVLEQMPPPYTAVTAQVAACEQAALEDYFLAVANVWREQVVETRSFMAQRLRRLLTRAPAEFRKTYESGAGAELGRYKDRSVSERLLWCWPEAPAAKQKKNELSEAASGLPSVEKQAALWRLGDLAGACGLGESGVRAGLVTPAPAVLASGAGFGEVEAKNEDPDMVRLTLPQRGELKEETAHLLFVGGRKRRTYANRFLVMCWDMKDNKKLWETQEILLQGQTVEGGEG